MTFSEVEDLRVKEIFTKGLGNDQKEGEGSGWDYRDFSSSFHTASPNQKALES